MIDQTKAIEAIRDMTKNEAWRDILVNAPGAADLRIALAFYASKFLSTMDQKEKDEYREYREMLERSLNAEELWYLTQEFGRMGVEAAQTHYKELFGKRPLEDQEKAKKAYGELMEKIGREKGVAVGENANPDEGDEEGDGEGSEEGEQPSEDAQPEAAVVQDEAIGDDDDADEGDDGEGVVTEDDVGNFLKGLGISVPENPVQDSAPAAAKAPAGIDYKAIAAAGEKLVKGGIRSRNPKTEPQTPAEPTGAAQA